MAQKNLLRYILLGMLENGKKTGYDLKKLFETEIGEFWSAKHSQIYLELKRLESQGYIASETGLYGNKLEKTYYTVTKKGQQLLREWTETPTEKLPLNKDEFVLKLYFIKDKNDPRIQNMLQRQFALHHSKLSHLNDRMELLFKNESARSNDFGHFLILDYAIRRESEYLNWIKQYL